jgi:hypothetical protein
MSHEKPRKREFRAWTWPTELENLEQRRMMGACASLRVADDPGDKQFRRVPVRIIIEDPSDPKPDWPIGTRVRLKSGPKKGCEYRVDSEAFWYDASWCFVDENGLIVYASVFEPVPPECSVVLKVTGSPEDIAKVRSGESAVWLPGYATPVRTLRVEVVE